jgi:SAM-dependent methyltransferase
VNPVTDPSDAEIPEPLRGVADLYTGNVLEHGPGPRSVGWKDADQQVLRFAKLLEVVAPADAAAGISVNDFGCGYGAMFEYLASREGLKLSRYVGYDISGAMLAVARDRIDDGRCELVEGPRITRKADYSFVSGTFNVKLEATDEQWGVIVKDAIRDLAAHSTRGFAFNLVTDQVDWKDDKLFYADPMEYFEFCRRNVSRYVSLLHDYPLYEWTLLVRMEDRGA